MQTRTSSIISRRHSTAIMPGRRRGLVAKKARSTALGERLCDEFGA
jgi:hypothetical protein